MKSIPNCYRLTKFQKDCKNILYKRKNEKKLSHSGGYKNMEGQKMHQRTNQVQTEEQGLKSYHEYRLFKHCKN